MHEHDNFPRRLSLSRKLDITLAAFRNTPWRFIGYPQLLPLASADVRVAGSGEERARNLALIKSLPDQSLMPTTELRTFVTTHWAIATYHFIDCYVVDTTWTGDSAQRRTSFGHSRNWMEILELPRTPFYRLGFAIFLENKQILIIMRLCRRDAIIYHTVDKHGDDTRWTTQTLEWKEYSGKLKIRIKVDSLQTRNHTCTPLPAWCHRENKNRMVSKVTISSISHP